MSSEADLPPPAPFPTKEGGARETASEASGEGSSEEAGAKEETASGERAAASSPHRRRKLLAVLVVVVGLVAFGIWYFAIRTPEPRDDFGRFQGEWRLALPAGMRDNKPVAQIKPVTIRVTGDRWVWLIGEKEQRRYQMTLRSEANPKEIDLTQLDRDDQPTTIILRGIYTIHGDHAQVMIAPNPDPRPTSLDADDGPPGWLMERVK